MDVSDTRGRCVTCGAIDGVRCEPWCPISGGPGKAQWSINRVAALEAQLRAAEAKLRTVDDVICWGVDCVHQAACSQHCLDADEQLAAADALAGAVREACGPQCGCRAAQALAAYDAARGQRG